MNLLEPWNLTYAVAFVVFIGVRSYYGRPAQREKKKVSRVDLLEQVLLTFLAIGNLLLPTIFLFTNWLDFADYRLPDWLPWVGVVFLLPGLWLFWRSHVDLGLNWSISLQIRERHTICKNGVYALMRHPMYASVWLWGVGQALMLENWLAGWGTIAPFAILYFLRTPREERMLCESLGEDYRAYMAATPRIFPRFNRNKNR